MLRFLSRCLALVLLIGSFAASGQIDPEKRQLIQMGYGQPLVGIAPIAAYGYYFRNDPGFLGHSNLTLRLAIAPVYLDSELGFSGALGPHTDLAFGLGGGGFADSYFEIENGNWIKGQSFTGNGGEVSASLYHLFNPNQLIPLSAVVHFTPHYTAYSRDSDTASNFVIPDDRVTLFLRTGLRWGGREPTIFPQLAMELSGWYEGQYRTQSGPYGINNDLTVEQISQLFWARALFIYTLPNLKHNFGINMIAGTSMDADRFSAYRLGGLLPVVSEFPLVLPGYYYQELSASSFELISGQYSLPLDPKHQWQLTGVASEAHVNFLPGLEQARHWQTGVSLGMLYRSSSGAFQLFGGYSYGFQAIRDGKSGGQSINILCQIDLEARHRPSQIQQYESPMKSRTLFRLFEQ